MNEKKNAERQRFGIIAADPLRYLGLQSMMTAVESATEILPVERVTSQALRSLSLVVVDASSTEQVFETITALRRALPSIRLVVVGLEADLAYVERVIGAGAKGYLTHSASADEIRMAIGIVLDGSVWAPRKVLARLIDRTSSAGGERGARPVFTRRERDVLGLLVAGSSNKEAGAALGIDEATVKAHVGRLMRKVGVTNRTALCVEATRRNLLRALEEPQGEGGSGAGL